MTTIKTWSEFKNKFKDTDNLSLSGEIFLINKLKTKDRNKALELLISHNLSTVHHIVLKYKWCNIAYEDLVQYGVLGIISAADSFDINKGNKFSTFAYHYILGRIRRALELHNHTIRIPAHINLAMSKISHLDLENEIKTEDLIKLTDKRYKLNHLEQAIEVKKQKIINLEEIFHIESYPENKDRKIIVEKLLSLFTEREKKIVILRFGFYDEKPHSFKEIDELLKFDSQQILHYAFERIKRDYNLSYLLELLNDE